MLEWTARQKTGLWRDLWSGNLTWLKSSSEWTIPPKYLRSATNIQQKLPFIVVSLTYPFIASYQLSLRTSIRGRRPTSLTPCSGCWSSTPPTWRSSSGRGQRSWKSRNRRQKSCWHKCCHRALTRTKPVDTTMRLIRTAQAHVLPSGLWPRLWKLAAQSNQSILAAWPFTSATSWVSPPSQPTANPSRWSTSSTISTPSLMLSSATTMSTRCCSYSGHFHQKAVTSHYEMFASHPTAGGDHRRCLHGGVRPSCSQWQPSRCGNSQHVPRHFERCRNLQNEAHAWCSRQDTYRLTHR